jgi:outer membrane receptor protein involved in Fe transport
MKQPAILKLLLAILFISFAITSSAHKGSMRGIIYDGATRKPLEGVSIIVSGTNISTASDAFGKFFVRDVEPGGYKVIITHIGFGPAEEDVTIEDGVTADLSFSLFPTPVQMASVSVNSRKDPDMTAISGPDLKLRPVNSTQDMLRLVPGLFTAQHQGGGKAEQVFLRGFDCDHGTDINISVDNMPVNMVSHAHGQGFADTHFIIPESVQQVDYGKGPYQADKGDFCTAGFVAFKTRNALNNSFVKTEAGSYGYFRTATGFNLLNKTQTGGHEDAYIIGEYGCNRGYFDLPQNFNRFNLIGKYTNYISSGKIISLSLSGFHSYWDASGQIPTRAINDGITGRPGGLDPEGGNTSRYNMNLQYLQSINSRSYFKSNIYLSWYTFRLYSDFTYFLVDTINGDQLRQAEKRAMGGYNSEYNSHYTFAGLKMKTQLGTGLRYDDVMNDELSHTAGKSVTLQQLELGDVHEANLYGYINQRVNILSNLAINLGTRYDYFSQQYENKLPTDARSGISNAGRFSPKAGISYNLSDNMRVYYSYGTGFHTNDTRVLVPGMQQGKPISPDNTIPLAFSHDLGIVFKPYSRLLLSAAAWRLDLQQEYTYNGDIATIDTAGKTRRYGADVSARYQLLTGLYLDVDVNYAHGRAINLETGKNYIPLAPTFTSTGGITCKMTNELSACLRYRHMGNRPANEDNTLTAAGYTIFDAVINYALPRYEFGMQVQNLFNTQWNEAQFATTTRLKYPNGTLEPLAKTDICFTPGTPFFVKMSAAYKF